MAKREKRPLIESVRGNLQSARAGVDEITAAAVIDYDVPVAADRVIRCIDAALVALLELEEVMPGGD